MSRVDELKMGVYDRLFGGEITVDKCDLMIEAIDKKYSDNKEKITLLATTKEDYDLCYESIIDSYNDGIITESEKDEMLVAISMNFYESEDEIKEVYANFSKQNMELMSDIKTKVRENKKEYLSAINKSNKLIKEGKIDDAIQNIEMAKKTLDDTMQFIENCKILDDRTITSYIKVAAKSFSVSYMIYYAINTYLSKYIGDGEPNKKITGVAALIGGGIGGSLALKNEYKKNTPEHTKQEALLILKKEYVSLGLYLKKLNKIKIKKEAKESKCRK